MRLAHDAIIRYVSRNFHVRLTPHCVFVSARYVVCGKFMLQEVRSALRSSLKSGTNDPVEVSDSEDIDDLQIAVDGQASTDGPAIASSQPPQLETARAPPPLQDLDEEERPVLGRRKRRRSLCGQTCQILVCSDLSEDVPTLGEE